MKILVVEDEAMMADFLDRGLTSEGHSITIMHDGIEGYDAALNGNYDIILLDILLPNKTGLEVCAELRSKGVETPIIMLTALDAIPDRIAGLHHGADDYLVKPYAFEELIARMDAVMRRQPKNRVDRKSNILEYGDIIFNRETITITRKGQVLAFTAKEVGILELLLERPGAVVSREHILDKVWGIATDPLTNIVDVYIGKVRRKLQEHGPNAIETVRGFGYRLV